MAYQHTFHRHKTREVAVGNVIVGGDNPVWVQSMTTPDTHDLEATVAQIHRLEERQPIPLSRRVVVRADEIID